MPKRGSLDSFFQPQAKAAKPATDGKDTSVLEAETPNDAAALSKTGDPHSASSASPPSSHPTYPFAIAQLPVELRNALDYLPACDQPRVINDQPDLDLLHYAPFLPKSVHRQLFEFLRSSLPFYRVKYSIKRGTFETQINTPRWTTVFGLDATSYFSEDGLTVFDSTTKRPVPKDKYKCTPRPIPGCLQALKAATEAITGESFNFVLVNYYADGADSISYHSDDERFLGAEPAIASFSLGAKRDFLMKHKPPQGQDGKDSDKAKPLKFALASGDMLLMRGKTQSNWLHSIPKRKGGEAEAGRINITLRKAVIKYGTENYNQYNVGTGPPYRWSDRDSEMVLLGESVG